VIGELRSDWGSVQYFNRDPQNLRNIAEWGGAGIWISGATPINHSRSFLGRIRDASAALIDSRPDFKTDRWRRCILEFPSGGQSVCPMWATNLCQLPAYAIPGTTRGLGRYRYTFNNAPSLDPSRKIFYCYGLGRVWQSYSDGNDSDLRPV